MAYHHHHHHAPPAPPPAAVPSCYCCCSPTQTHHLPPPPPPPQPAQPDPLLVDAVVSRLLCLHSYQTPRKPQPHDPFQHYRPLGKNPDLSSLVDRIEALEASLHRFSFSSRSVVTVRDMAARVIQRRFRAFLARRSRILRQLQDLAVVKSSYTMLRSSVSNSSRVRFEHVSRKAWNLLMQLDSIEEDDPMITEGKRSIGRNLDRFLRYVDGRSDEALPSHSNSGRRIVSNGRKDNVRFRAQRDMVNDLRDRVERIQKMSRVFKKEERADDADLKGLDDFSDLEEEKDWVSIVGGIRSLSRGVKKRVKFAENGNASQVISNSDEQSLNEGEDDSGDDSIKDSKKFKKVGVKDSPKDQEEGPEDSGGLYSDGSDGGMSGRSQQKEGMSGIKGEHRGQNAGYVFTPPVPEKMESVAVMKKKKEMKS